MKPIKNPLRCYRNRATGDLLRLEDRGADLAELLSIAWGKAGCAALEAGDAEGAAFPCSLGVALIDRVKTIREMVAGIITGAHRIIADLKQRESGQEARS